MGIKRILMIVGDFSEDYEVMVPFQALQIAGHKVDAVCPDKDAGDYITTAVHQSGIYQTYMETAGHRFTLNATFDTVDVEKYDALVLPGGKAPEYLRTDERVLNIVKGFAKDDKPIAAICHGPQILISAGVLWGRKCTGHRSIKVDVENAGGIWVDIDKTEAFVDGKLVTAQSWRGIVPWIKEFLKVLGTRIEP